MLGGVAKAEEVPVTTIENAKDLGRYLGASAQVDGDEVTLLADFELTSILDFAGGDITINCNGKNKKVTKSVKKVLATKSATSMKLKSLKKDTTYYVKIRAFKKQKGKKVYGLYSKIKKIR